VTRVLACALCSGGSHAPTSPWTVAAGVVIVAFCILVACNRRKAGLPPIADTMSPWARELLAGRNITAYRSSVRAETPAGIMVTYRECCRSGHQLPEQAVDHAGQIATRIGEHGR
jgi:HAMP domain-containing protein